MKKDLWLYIVLLCIIASVLTLFLPVVTYVYPDGKEVSFNVLNFLEPTELSRVLRCYTGTFRLHIDKSVVTGLGIMAVAAIASALTGVITMSRQRPNRWQFVMALIGIIGTAIPSVLILVMVIVSVNYFPGNFYPGVYPVVTPITMVICMITVTRKHKMTQAQLRAVEASKGLIYRGGDLE